MCEADYDTQQARLPKGYDLWGNYGDGRWRVSYGQSVVATNDTAAGAVDAVLRNFKPE